MCGDVAKW